jgi:hypothetical protein
MIVEKTKKRSWRTYVFTFFAFIFALGSFVALQSVEEGLLPWWHERYVGEEWFSKDFLWQYGAHGVLVGILFGGSLVSLLWRADLKPVLMQFYTIGHIIFLTVSYITYDAMMEMPFVTIMFCTTNIILISTYIKPRELFKFHRADQVNKPLLYLSIILTLVLLPQVWNGLATQWQQVGGEFRWGEMAVMYIMLILASFGAAFCQKGAKGLSILSSIAYLYLAILSISIPEYQGSWGYLGGILSLFVSGCFIYFSFIKKKAGFVNNQKRAS